MAKDRLLLVEDDDVLLENLAEVLRAEGFEVLTARNGCVAQSLATESMPDLIVSDVMMPDMDGFTLARELAKEPHTALIPLIFLTAKSTQADFRTGLDLGAEDYLPKPCPVDKLISVIRMRLERRRMMQTKLADEWYGMGLSKLAVPSEIATPLRQVLGFAGVLVQHHSDLDREEIGRVAQNIMAGAFRLSRKITQAQVRERRKIGSWLSPPDSGCDAALSLKRVAAQTRMCWSQGCDLQLSVQPAMLMIHESVLDAVVAELLDNAFRYSGAGAVVHLLGKCTAENYEISVQDQGPGLISEGLVNVEVPLPPDAPSGTLWGGLTGVRHLLESCNIKLEVDSVPGSGTTVRFTVPCTVPSGPRPEVQS